MMNHLKTLIYATLISGLASQAVFAEPKEKSRYDCTPSIDTLRGIVVSDVLDMQEKTSLEVVIGQSKDTSVLIGMFQKAKNTSCPPPEYFRELRKVNRK